MAKREGFQTAGAVAGCVAFVGMVALYFMVQIALEELVAKNNAAHKAMNKDVADITVDFGPGGFLDLLLNPWALVVILALGLIWLGVKVNQLSKRA